MYLVAGQFRALTQGDLAFARQIGCRGVLINKPDFDSPAWVEFLGKQFGATAGPRPPATRFAAMELIQLRRAVESHGLTLEAIEGVPRNWLDQAMLGLEGAARQIEDFKATIRAMGQAGIPVLGYNFIPDQVWRTARAGHGRGGALVTEYDHALGARVATGRLPPRTEAERWQAWEAFIEAVLPVAEAEGVTLALHPDDPPVPVLDGVARIFRNQEAFARAMAHAPSRHHAVNFCVGTFASAGAGSMYEALDVFARAGRIAYVHLRNVAGELPRFAESFIDEGSVDPARVIRILHQAGFEKFIIDDHVPHVEADTVWGHRARAHATGYIAGMIRMLPQAKEPTP